MKVFVTGATGFIGSHVLNAAATAGHEVVALRLVTDSCPRVALRRNPVWIDGSIDEVKVADFAGCDVLLHLAAAGVTPQPADWEICFRVNLLQTIALVDRALAAGVRRVVVAGSYAEYGLAGLRFDPIPPDAPLEPTDPYAASKAAASIALVAMARVRGFELVYPRLFSVFGAGQYERNFWPELRKAALAGEDFAMTAGDQVRDFISVDDVATWLVKACARENLLPSQPLVVNLASGRPVTLRAFAETWWARFGATGHLLPGAIPHRTNEVMRFVPLVQEIWT